MRTFQSVLTLVQPQYYLATVDLKDVYHSVETDEPGTAYLKLLFSCSLSKYIVLPRGLFPGTPKFTKLKKPQLAFLNLQGQKLSSI